MVSWLHKPVAIARRIRSRYLAHAVILLYHRAADLSVDPFELAVTPQNFDEQLAVLSRYARPMSLAQLLAAVQRGRVPRRAVVVTFDDGYADNLYEAKPLLERYAIPATVFLAGQASGEPREFWWDRLQRLVLGQESVADSGWRFWSPDLTPCHTRFRTLYAKLIDLPPEEQQAELDRLHAESNVGQCTTPQHRRLTPDEVGRLAEGKLVEIGGHTLNHPALPNLSSSEQFSEIVKNKTSLEDVVGQKVVGFSYPNGCYSRETIDLVRKAGFQSACTTRTCAVRPRTDCYQLPRFWPGNWDGDKFLAHLSNWFRK